MSSDARCSIYIGNLDEKVTDRVLYDILIQAGRVLDLHIPRDRDTDEPKGFAFAEYESEEVADYAVKLFSGLVTLYNRTLKFAISGQDKPLQNGVPNGLSSASNLVNKPRSHPGPNNDFETSHQTGFLTPRRGSAYSFSGSLDPPGVVHHHNGYNGTNYDSGRRLFGSAVEAISRPRSHRYDSDAEQRFSNTGTERAGLVVEDGADNEDTNLRSIEVLRQRSGQLWYCQKIVDQKCPHCRHKFCQRWC